MHPHVPIYGVALLYFLADSASYIISIQGTTSKTLSTLIFTFSKVACFVVIIFKGVKKSLYIIKGGKDMRLKKKSITRKPSISWTIRQKRNESIRECPHSRQYNIIETTINLFCERDECAIRCRPGEKVQKYISFIAADISTVLYGRGAPVIKLSQINRERRPDYTSFRGTGRE